ncbi:MAG TPA: hypothetical protein VMK12_33220, partial [Anaeromyxobacteraceae bacterium]|nr:hypothetical protein [Anaeromyxobacteraceae bacterium]
MVFQDHRLFPWLTVGQNVAFALGGDPSRVSSAVVQWHVELVGLAAFRGAYLLSCPEACAASRRCARPGEPAARPAS